MFSFFRVLENLVLENQTLNSHWETVASMIKECENKVDLATPQSPVDLNTRFSQNVNQGVEEVKQRMSKMFNTKQASTKQNTLPNLQSIFKKK